MKKLISIFMVLLLAGFSQLASAAGGPLNEDLTILEPIAKRAIEAGKQGDAQAFLKETNELLTETQSQPDSAKQQRILTRVKKAIRRGESGKLNEGVQAIEEAMVHMEKSDDPKFGGGS